MVMQSCSADCDHALIPSQFPQWRYHIFASLLYVTRMNADHREDIRIFLRQRDRAAAALDRCPDRDDPRYARFCCAPEHVIEVRCEIRVIEVGVGLYEHLEEVTS